VTVEIVGVLDPCGQRAEPLVVGPRRVVERGHEPAPLLLRAAGDHDPASRSSRFRGDDVQFGERSGERASAGGGRSR